MVDIKNLSKAFGSHVVLDNVSISVEKGDNFVVFGRSGTGKSVLLKCIVRLLEPDAGEIIVDDINMLGLKEKELIEARKQIGFLFQSGALYDSMTVKENLEFPLIRNFKLSEKQRDDKIREVLKNVGLEAAINKMPAELSGGMKKRIALARTIISEPKLILYDEPTTGLDPITVKEISELIVELQKDLNITSIVVTHDIICAKIVANHAVVINEGKILFQGDVSEMEKSEDRFLKKFFSMDVENQAQN
ncbi:MAG: ATP-binding cassette domain-containing protein [Ignavibacteriaceae bacterium]